MTPDPDPFEQGERAGARVFRRSRSVQDGSEQHALWATGHEKVAGAIEANESEGSSARCCPAAMRRASETAQPIFFRPDLKRGPLMA